MSGARWQSVVALMLIAAAIPVIGGEPTTSPSVPFAQALHPREWHFPRDHGRHDGFKTEWWYFTGNLRDASGRRFGYQLTFFRTAYKAQPTTRPSKWGMNDLYFAHAAITDVSGKTFTFKDCLHRGRAGLAESSAETLDVSLLDWSARLNDGTIHLNAAEPGFAIDLNCSAGRGPVMEGEGGVNPKGPKPGQASYYYSMTRLRTTGSLQLGEQKFQVEGQSWMDHEFSSNALGPEQIGWDWLGLTLADGTDLMIYRLRNSSGGTDYLSGTRITSDGKVHYLTASEIQLDGSQPWKSPASGGLYPQEWRLAVAGKPTMTIRSLLPGQELLTPNSTNVDYFEGAVDVLNDRGDAVGEGYLEMTGYAKPLGGAMQQ